MRAVLILLNLSLLVVFPIAWTAPIMKAGFVPFFALDHITVLTGLQALWASDVFLAVIVTSLALFAPYLKTIGLALLHFGLLAPSVMPVLQVLGKLAMADIFLVAVFIIVSKGIGVGRVETAWGLYVFSTAILISLVISILTPKVFKTA